MGQIYLQQTFFFVSATNYEFSYDGLQCDAMWNLSTFRFRSENCRSFLPPPKIGVHSKLLFFYNHPLQTCTFYKRSFHWIHHNVAAAGAKYDQIIKKDKYQNAFFDQSPAPFNVKEEGQKYFTTTSRCVATSEDD